MIKKSHYCDKCGSRMVKSEIAPIPTYWCPHCRDWGKTIKRILDSKEVKKA